MGSRHVSHQHSPSLYEINTQNFHPHTIPRARPPKRINKKVWESGCRIRETIDWRQRQTAMITQRSNHRWAFRRLVDTS